MANSMVNIDTHIASLCDRVVNERLSPQQAYKPRTYL